MQPRSRFALKTYVFLCSSENSRSKGMAPDQKSNNSFTVFGGNVFKQKNKMLEMKTTSNGRRPQNIKS